MFPASTWHNRLVKFHIKHLLMLYELKLRAAWNEKQFSGPLQLKENEKDFYFYFSTRYFYRQIMLANFLKCSVANPNLTRGNHKILAISSFFCSPRKKKADFKWLFIFGAIAKHHVIVSNWNCFLAVFWASLFFSLTARLHIFTQLTVTELAEIMCENVS